MKDTKKVVKKTLTTPFKQELCMKLKADKKIQKDRKRHYRIQMQ